MLMQPILSLSTKFKVAFRTISDCDSGAKEVEGILGMFEIASPQGVLPALKTASKRALTQFP